MTGPRYVDAWRFALFASDERDRVKVVLLRLSYYADWDDGSNVFVSVDRLAREVHKSRARTNEAVSEAVAHGWIKRVGNGPNNVGRYTLVLPVVPEAEQPAVPEAAQPHSEPSPPVVPISAPVVPILGAGCAEVGTQPHQTSPTVRSEEDDDARGGAPADAAAARAVSAGARATTRSILAAMRSHSRKPWREARIDATRLHDAVSDRLAVGWSEADLARYALTVGGTPRDPAGMLAAHLRRAPDDAASWIADQPEGESPADERPARRKVGDPRADLIKRMQSSIGGASLTYGELWTYLYENFGRAVAYGLDDAVGEAEPSQTVYRDGRTKSALGPRVLDAVLGIEAQWDGPIFGADT